MISFLKALLYVLAHSDAEKLKAGQRVQEGANKSDEDERADVVVLGLAHRRASMLFCKQS